MVYFQAASNGGEVRAILDPDPLDPDNLSLDLDAGLRVRFRFTEETAIRLAQALNNWYFAKYFDELDAEDDEMRADVAAYDEANREFEASGRRSRPLADLTAMTIDEAEAWARGEGYSDFDTVPRPAADEETAIDITTITNQPGNPKAWPI